MCICAPGICKIFQKRWRAWCFELVHALLTSWLQANNDLGNHIVSETNGYQVLAPSHRQQQHRLSRLINQGTPNFPKQLGPRNKVAAGSRCTSGTRLELQAFDGAPAQLLVGLGQYAARASPSSHHASPRSAFSPEPSGLFGHRVVVRTAIQGTGLPSSCMHILSLFVLQPFFFCSSTFAFNLFC